MPSAKEQYLKALTAAVNDMAEHGFDEPARVTYWQDQLRAAAERVVGSTSEMEAMLRRVLEGVYRKWVDRGEVLRYNRGVGRYTLERIRPYLRNELDRRIMASAQLIRLNRAQAIDQTLRRFSGWSTSIPKGGTAPGSRVQQKRLIKKSLTSLPYQQRRVLIDQGHKLASSINAVVASDGGAIAGEWHSHWRQANYDYRPDHKDRDGRVYLIRGSWAQQKGLVRPGTVGYSDEVTQPGEEVNCRCYFKYLYSLRQLPRDMLTAKGLETLERARALMEAA